MPTALYLYHCQHVLQKVKKQQHNFYHSRCNLRVQEACWSWILDWLFEIGVVVWHVLITEETSGPGDIIINIVIIVWHTLSYVSRSKSNLGCFRPWALWHHPLTLVLAPRISHAGGGNSTRLSWHHWRVCLNFKGVGAVVLCQISACKRENPSTDRWSGLENVKQKSYWFMNYPQQAFKTTAGTVTSSVYNHLYFFALDAQFFN